MKHGFALLFFSATAAAQQTLPEVSVTGTRERDPLAETPAAVGVIQGETVR